MNSAARNSLLKLFPGARTDVPFSTLTTMRVGGNAAVLADPGNTGELQSLLYIIREHDLPSLIIGKGSNLVVSDRGFDGVVYRLGGDFKAIEFRGDTVIAGGGAGLAMLSRMAAERGFSGLEFAAGIPGTVGGAVVMNAGAHGEDISGITAEVHTVTLNGVTETVSGESVKWGYRHGIDDSRIISTTIFKIFNKSIDIILKKMDNNQNVRKDSQPTGFSAGSVFRNPEGGKAWQFIRDAGFSGFKMGGAVVSDKHANFILNTGNATAADVAGLIRAVQKGVREKFGIELIPEIRLIGEFEE